MQISSSNSHRHNTPNDDGLSVDSWQPSHIKSEAKLSLKVNHKQMRQNKNDWQAATAAAAATATTTATENLYIPNFMARR